jgi:UDP-galactopyranose mutase
MADFETKIRGTKILIHSYGVFVITENTTLQEILNYLNKYE